MYCFRYSSKKPPNITDIKSCKHKKCGKLKCDTLNPQDIRKFHEAFYAKPNKTFQDNFMLKYMKVHVPKHRKRIVGNRAESKSYTKFYVRTYVKPYKLIRVCQQAFSKILNVGIHRLRNISKKFLLSGNIPEENRGGDRISGKNYQKKQNVMKFIESFKCIEGHYCRSATSERKYVSSDLSIRKMWKMYQNQQGDESLKVRHCYFRNIFNTNYNIGFKTPRVDVCSKCMELSEKIKRAQNEEKITLMAALRIHKLKAKCFFTFLREYDQQTLSISFDCQKNQVLPRVPDQAAYYSRQLYIYNFTIVIGNATNTFPKENVRIHTWTENVHAKSSNEIASAVFNLLSETDFTGIKKLRMLADGCGSQNKNSTMIAMVSYWLTSCAPSNVKMVELIFPVPGHSFMPADRIFGYIEKDVKNKEVILNPSEYINIYKRYGTVRKLGVDYSVKDWKSYSKEIMKPPSQYHFKFAECKRYYVTRVKNKPGRFLLRGEVNYKSDLGVAKSVLKPSVSSTSEFGIRDVPPFQNQVSALKLSDVKKLLSNHFGEDWNSALGNNELLFYKNVLERTNVGEPDDEEHCEYLPEVGMSV